MKKYLVVLLLASLFSVNSIYAQTEVKLNPVALLFGAGILSVEQGFNDNFGAELTLLGVDGGGLIGLAGKYYLNPRQGFDRFHVGGFVGATEGGGAFGFLLGTKIVADGGFLFEVGGGLGRVIGGDIGGGDAIIPYLKFDIGYRFGAK